jgi:LysR family hydrogen peroxide-inducible transcriptional activator
MELHQLRYFAKVAELENFTRAAEACHVSQPSLSQQIANLERELGQPLFERLPRGARLTDAGRAFKARIDEALRLLDDAKSQAADDGETGRLVIGAIPTVAPYFLPGLAAMFREECPGAVLEIVEDTTAALVSLLRDGAADLALLALPVAADGLERRELLTEELVALLPAGHPAATGDDVALEDLAHEPFILLNEAHCLGPAAMAFCHGRSVFPLVTGRMHQLATVQALVSAGRGVSLAPKMAADRDTCPSRAYRRLRGERPTRTIGTVWIAQRFRTKLFGRLVGLCRRRAADLR